MTFRRQRNFGENKLKNGFGNALTKRKNRISKERRNWKIEKEKKNINEMLIRKKSNY